MFKLADGIKYKFVDIKESKLNANKFWVYWRKYR